MFPPEPESPQEPEAIDVPPLAEDDEDDFDAIFARSEPVAYRGATSDPTFGYLIAVAFSVGLTALPPNNDDMRYTLAWGMLALFAVLAWLLGSSDRIGQEKPENLAWGVVFGLLIGAPLYMFGGETLNTTVILLFPNMGGGVVLAYLLFVMPMAESLFFRGLLQQHRPFWFVGILSSIWSMVLYFPVLDVGQYPAVGILIGTTVLLMNMTYSYVCRRNSLAASWLCQIVVNLVVLFLPFISQA